MARFYDKERIMNYYGYSGKKSKHRSNKRTVIIRVLIIVLAVVGSVTFALVLGNRLKGKLEDADISKEPIENIIPEKPVQKEEEPDPVFKEEASFEELSFTGGYLDLADCPDGKSAASFVKGLKAAGYTSVIFDVRDENGKLTYSSTALSELVGAATSGSVTSAEILSAALSEATNQGMKKCAYVELLGAYTGKGETVLTTVDSTVVGELAAIGFDRFILSGVFGGEFTSDAVNAFYSHVETLRKAAPDAYFGVVLSPTVFEAAELTPTLELMFRYTDFFAVDFSDSGTYSADAVATFRDNFSGSLNAYRINVLLDGATEKSIKSGYETFIHTGANVSFLTQKNDYTKEKDEDGNFLYSSKIPAYSVLPEEEADTEKAD